METFWECPWTVDYSPKESWKWESVLADNIFKDKGPYITYFVLYIPRDEIECPWSHWNKIVTLTLRSKLGYRSAISSDVMFSGLHRGCYTVILEFPVHLLRRVEKKLKQCGLYHHLKELRQRRRFADPKYPKKKVLKYYY